MSTIVRTAEAPANRPDLLRRRVIGTPSEVAATVALIQASGLLVGTTTPRQLHAGDDRVMVIVTLHPLRQQSSAVRPAVRCRWVRPVVIAGVSSAVLVGLLYAAHLALQQALHAVAAGSPAVIGVVLVLVALVLALAAGRRKGACVGLHCSGCGHR